MIDIVERLRRWQSLETAGIHGEAADEIDSLRQRVQELEVQKEAALRIAEQHSDVVNNMLGITRHQDIAAYEQWANGDRYRMDIHSREAWLAACEYRDRLTRATG